MDGLISVIVPVYNVEKYLEKCIESILNQTYKNIEVILINDGSTDKSGEICEELVQRDIRVKVIHKKNEGLSSARNEGIEKAIGEYIAFLDSDDYIIPESYEYLYKLSQKYYADIVSANFKRIDENDFDVVEKIIEEDNKKIEVEEKKLKKENVLDILYGTEEHAYIQQVVVWNKLYKSHLFHNIRFPKGKLHEDEFTTFRIFSEAENIVMSTKIIHGYMQTKNSIMRSEIKDKRIKDNLEAYKNAIQFFKEKQLNSVMVKVIRRYLEMCIELSGKIKKENSSDKEEKLEYLKERFNEYYIYFANEVNQEVEKHDEYLEILKQAYRIQDIYLLWEVLYKKRLKEKSFKEKEEIVLEQMKAFPINVLTVEESIEKLIKTKKSLSRFGDGELDIINGKNIKFQKFDLELAEKLKKILREEKDNCLIGITDAINTFDNLTQESKTFWINNMYEYRETWFELLNRKIEYCSANLTRLYIRYQDKSNTEKNFELIKSLWKDRDIVIIEGGQTKLGVGNDLLYKCNSVKRIECPMENAFEKYQEIIETVKKIEKDKLILIALGPTATILAYELSELGYQAIDLGHLDIEYEWFKKGIMKREKIQGKYTNEVIDGNKIEVELLDQRYLQQIIKVIR